MNRVVCIVQARNGSSRLPGKVLMDLAGQPLLGHLICRLRKCNQLDELVIATTDNERDLPVVELARQAGVAFFCGDEDDVLSRYVGAAKKSCAEIVVRVTGDCPLIDPDTVDNVVGFLINNDYDYVAAGTKTGFPRGLDVEAFYMDALLRADSESNDQASREHVTYYMYQHPEVFKIGNYPAPSKLRHPDWRLCIDEIDDFNLLSEIYRRLYKPERIINMLEVVELLKNEEQLTQINAHVKQKAI